MKKSNINKRLLVLSFSAIASLALSGCNANGVSSVLNITQQLQGSNGVSQEQLVNASALLEGMEEREKVRFLQAQMNQMGYSVGAADGIAGPATRRAVQRFQNDNGLNSSGVFDKPTVDLIMISMLESQQPTTAQNAALHPNDVLTQLQQLQQLQQGLQRGGMGAGANLGGGNEVQTILNIMNSLPK